MTADIYDEARAERATHSDKGWTAAHDAEHGTAHLIEWAREYAARRPLTRRDIVKAMSLLGAASDLIVGDGDTDSPPGTSNDLFPALLDEAVEDAYARVRRLAAATEWQTPADDHDAATAPPVGGRSGA